jgi:hypothetical protein
VVRPAPVVVPDPARATRGTPQFSPLRNRFLSVFHPCLSSAPLHVLASKRVLESAAWLPPPPGLFCFYICVFVVATIPTLFGLHDWHEALNRGWNLVNEHTQTIYANGAQTMIIAAGVPVAAWASSTVASAKNTNTLVAFSAKVAVVCLISCVCLPLLLILALWRGFEWARSRHMDEQRGAGQVHLAGEGRFHPVELLSILVPSWLALSCFLVGFVFLDRVAFHF